MYNNIVIEGAISVFDRYFNASFNNIQLSNRGIHTKKVSIFGDSTTGFFLSEEFVMTQNKSVFFFWNWV